MNASVSPVEPGRSGEPWTLFSKRRRLGFLAVLSLVATSNFIDRNILGILIEPIKKEFGASDTMMGLLTGVCFALFYATLGIPIARLADRGNRVRIINLSLIAWSIMTALSGVAMSFWQLALARVGVGAGEAGAIPPAQSLIADYFPPSERARAFAVFTLASTAGYLFGFAGGGWVAQTYGWRMTFLVVGAPGLLLALLVKLVLREPRLLVDYRAVFEGPSETIGDTLRVLVRKPAFLLIVGSMVLYYFLSYGALIFTASFIVRVHGLGLAQAGAIFGTIAATAAVVGSLFGGTIADTAAKRDVRWLCWIAAIGFFAAWPLHLLAFLTLNTTVMFVAIFAAVSVLSAVIPCLIAALHMVCGSRRRATAIAFAYFAINLVGLGLGPILTGLLSDHFSATLGSAEGLRYSLVTMVTIFLPSGFCVLAAARFLKQDSET